eukprot:1081541-Lingulodinium_polyedra.AAC.1
MDPQRAWGNRCVSRPNGQCLVRGEPRTLRNGNKGLFKYRSSITAALAALSAIIRRSRALVEG